MVDEIRTLEAVLKLISDLSLGEEPVLEVYLKSGERQIFKLEMTKVYPGLRLVREETD
jgi:hypothetical protein